MEAAGEELLSGARLPAQEHHRVGGGRGIDARPIVRRGNPAAEIVTAARAEKADMIAMTTHGRSGLGRLLFGSVAEAVLRGAEVPVFLMRQTAAQVGRPIGGKETAR